MAKNDTEIGLGPRSDSAVVDIDGRRLKLTNLDKVLYPSTGTTKADVIGYYAAIAEVMIPHTHDRPATRKRWVHGVGTAEHPGEVFFQKNLDNSAPDWLRRGTIAHKSGTNVYPIVDDRATLVWFGQIAALEVHVPQWRFGRNGQPRNPDRLVLDLDPGEGVGLAECAEVARYARAILGGMGIDPLPVTSGSKGIHLYAPLDGRQNSDAVSAVAHELARALEADHRDLVVSDMKRELRAGKVFVDWSQNNAAKTTIAPYSLRGRLHPTVAAPRTWKELASKDLAQLDYHEVLERVEKGGDPLAGLYGGRTDDDVHAAAADRLTSYRSKRDASKTPEPVPETAAPVGAGAAQSTTGRTFVIQEHHARRLHWDFRLEHDGVLVSWALPKGVPTDTGTNHLAVHVEDHPLEYGAFSGDIPRGEYGAGHVTIWDAGDYDIEKWRDGKEVIATLHGTPGGGLGGDRRFALIHTGGEGKADQNWLIHLMKPAEENGGVEKGSSVKGSSARSVDATAPGEAGGRNETRATGATHPPVSAMPVSATPVSATPVSATPVSPMLATLGSPKDIFDESDWAFEMKWDGIRAIATVEDGALRLVSRNGIDQTVTYPDLEPLVALVGHHSAVLDGEIVALDHSGRPDFGLLQTRMKLTRHDEVAAAVKRTPAHYMLFDLLELDGESLMGTTYVERRAALNALVRPPKGSSIQVPPAFDGNLAHAVASSQELGLEGVMAKQRDGTYSAGRRSRTWIKIKNHRTLEVVIGGWRPGTGRRANSIGSLLLGIPEGDSLRYIGRVGTGFTDATLEDLRKELSAHPRKTSPLTDVPSVDARDAHWVRPELVGEVSFAEWTPTRRLRQASWRGRRYDKSLADINVEL